MRRSPDPEREQPSAFIRARTLSLRATRRGTFLRMQRVMSVSTHTFIKAY